MKEKAKWIEEIFFLRNEVKFKSRKRFTAREVWANAPSLSKRKKELEKWTPGRKQKKYFEIVTHDDDKRRWSQN